MQTINRRGALGLGLAGTAAIVGVAAAAPAAASPANNTSLVGTWALGVKFPDGTVNPTLISFDSAGSVVETNALTRSTGLGAWQHGSGIQFSCLWWEQFFDADNALQSHIRVEHHITLERGRDRYHGSGKGDVYDLNWNLVNTIATTFTAKRLN